MKTQNTPRENVIFVFDRNLNIASGDFSEFLTLYSPHLHSPEQLRNCYASVTFCVSGYDDDPRELTEIPEVRLFFQRLHCVWPYFAFFSSTMCENALMFMSCVIPGICVQRKAEAQKFRMAISTVAIQKLVTDSMVASRELFIRAGISEDGQRERIRELVSDLTVLNG